MMPMMGGMGFWIILVILLVVGFVAVMINQQQVGSTSAEEKRKGISKSAREIADERLATGDISPEEHQDIRQRIQDQA